MAEIIELFYNTRSRRNRQNPALNKRLSDALISDIQTDSEFDEDGDEVDGFEDSDDDDIYYSFPNVEEASDVEDELIVEANELSESEDDGDEDECETNSDESSEDDTFFYGKDGTKWRKDAPEILGRARNHNIMRFRSGPRYKTAVPLEMFKNLFTPNLAIIIIAETNRYAKSITNKWNDEHPDSVQKVWKELTSTELNAFVGLLLAAGMTHNNMQNAKFLWKPDGLPIFRATMSYKRFVAISRYIRFDNSRSREFRQRTDKAAAIRDIWNILNENLTHNYEPHENITIDEQLFPYRGRTKFTQYIPSKPAKYGIKVWWACDAKTKYPWSHNYCGQFFYHVEWC